ncbi:MAG: beta-galactosidase [Verrucomicrobiota bacterium]
MQKSLSETRRRGRAVRAAVGLAVGLLVGWSASARAFDGFIKMKDGYFLDAGSGKPWVPHGIAYQTWNRPLGVWQSFGQVDYDLDEMVKMGANSIRVDFVWQHIEETGDNQWSWANYDYLIQACEQRGIRIFALIGYQWPPGWFPDAWYTMHPPDYDSGGIWHGGRWSSDIINYEHPQARAQYAEFFSNVCGRYKNSKAIVAWIVGNEYGYLGLWSGLLDGYDPQCEQAFRNWCEVKYGTISSVNAQWGTSYPAFSNIVFVEQYREYGSEGAEWADMVQWREESIAGYTAAGAAAARAADTNHLLSYSTVGMQWGEEDWRYHAEDRGKITRACAATNAPLSFFSVNNYPWSILGHESQNGHWGISYTKKVTISTNDPQGMPVLYTETGFTSSETMWPGMNEYRQGPLIRNALWESLEAGAIGTHIFAWHDRPYITDREKGFGVLYADRNVKAAFWVSRDTYMLMDQINIHNLLAGSKDPKPDVAFLWTAANDSQFNRYECEMQQISGALERLGYEPNFVNLEDLASGVYTNYKMIILPRNMRVDTEVPGTGKGVLQFLRENVLTKGIHILASADLPGMQNQNGNPLPGYTNELAALFGIDASDAGGFEVAPRTGNYIASNTVPITVVFSNAPGVLTNGYRCTPQVWKYNDEVRVLDGTVWAKMDVRRNKGFEDSDKGVPNWFAWSTNNMTIQHWFPMDGTNMLQMWGDAGIWQDFQVAPFGRYVFSTYLRNNNDDPLRNGKQGYLSIEWYDNNGQIISTNESPRLTTNTPGNAWVQYKVDAVAPSNAIKGRRIIRITGSGDGSLYVDHYAKSPAVVVKNHGTAKAAIFLFSSGDMLPDGNEDWDMDVLPWQWRYDYFGSVVRDYFGVQPPLQVLGTNAFLCLAEYRTCTNGATLWQVKNYMYDRFAANQTGGDPQTFTLASPLLLGRNIRAYEQGRVLETNSDGTIQLTLAPDGQEMFLAYTAGTNNLICQLADAPAVIHPFGDKNYSITIKYDTLGKTNLTLKIALVGGLNGKQVYQTIATNVTGAGSQVFWMWIPDANQSDTNYVSTPDGGSYTWQTWLEDPASNAVATAASQSTQLKWGISPASPLPTSMTKGISTNIAVEWEELYEYLYWQHSPMSRNDAFPTRVALFRSTKTEQQFPGHLDRVNQVCDWLESLGYSNGNDLDISFDNIVVSTGVSTGGTVYLFNDDLEGTLTNWTTSGLWHLATDLSSSPTHSWAYNNGTNYNTGVRNSGTLETRWIDLTAVAGATLSFKSWYETEDTGTSWDRKLVYASVDGTNWTQLLQVSGPNKQWTTASYDLGTYAGQRIKLRFLFDTMDALYNTFKGWYVDDVKVAALSGTPVELFADTMESTTNWVGDGLWRLATNRAASGTKSWVYNNGSNYNTGVRSSGSLVSRWIDLTGISRATLAFKSWYRTEDTGTTWDRKLVYVSADGTNWAQVGQVSGSNQQWTAQALDLGAYSGQRIKLRFFFDTVDGLANQFEGWYVDDVKITTVSSAGMSVFSDAVEAGTNGWSAAGLWHQAGDLYAGPTHSWAYNNGSNYNTGARNSGALVTPWIDLTTAESATLSFQSWYETEDTGISWDKKLVYASTDGTNWTQVLQVSGPNKQWTMQSCDLSPFVGRQIKIKFFFDSVDGLYNSYRGWYLDNLNVRIVASGVLLFEPFNGGLGTGWTRAAGAANWTVEGGALRAWRIGNDDNILAAGDPAWTNYAVEANIRYNRQGPYLNNAELYLRYQNRDNFVKVLIQNFYGFWRLKYIVRVDTNNVTQGWIYEFSKTNQPAENTWYNLKVDAQGTNYTVYLDGKNVGSFGSPASFPYTSGRIAIGTTAGQLGIWEPQKGYFFIDDDEYSYWSAENPGGGTLGHPLNLDWGYLRTFYGTVILPSTFVMSDTEVSNVITWVHGGTYNVIATDGGIARKNEAGQDDLGRIESIFGVAPAVTTISGLNRLTVGTSDHYVALDYAPGAQLTAAGTGTDWTTVTSATAVVTADNGSSSIPAALCNLTGPDVWSPSKAFCFNFPVDTQGQLTNACRQLARRAFEWTRGEAHRVLVQLKCQTPAGGNYDFVVAQGMAWVLGGTGSTNVFFSLPTDGIMTGTNLYWAIFNYPWDAGYPWGAHAGFYTSINDGPGKFVSIPGIGLQIIGVGNKVFAGREWDLWVAWNAGSSNYIGEYGLKDREGLTSEDNFNDGNYSGWTIAANPNISWTVSNGALRATVVSTGGYAYITRDGLNVTGRNVTIEYTTRFMNGATNGGIVYAGRVLYVNPQLCGWNDTNVYLYYTNLVSTGAWQHVRLNVRDGDPYLRSDLFVNDRVVFMDEPIEVTNLTSASVGFLSSYYQGYTEWDNFRVADEQYGLVTQAVTGVYIPTNAFWPFVPDYDPGSWEHEGSTLGAQYEWYFYLRGGDAHSYSNTAVYFAPRLMVENPAFPTNMHSGQTVQVPVEWENLDQVPEALTIGLEDPYVGTSYVSQVFTVTNKTGTGWFPVTLPGAMPSGNNFLWVSYMHPTGSLNPLLERVGLDDTFRFNAQGLPVGPETTIIVTPPPGEEFTAYSDLGLPLGCNLWIWGSGSVDGNYTGITTPEGVKCIYATTASSIGYGVFYTNTTVDLSAYADGFLKFWLKSSTTVYVELEGPQGTKKNTTVPSTTNQWKEISIPITTFSSVVNLSKIMGLGAFTVYGLNTFYVDHIRWVRGVYRVYRDFGIPVGCTNLTWSGGAATFEPAYLGDTPPEGSTCYRASSGTWSKWGVFKTNTLDMAAYSNGFLRFWLKSTNALKVQLEGPQGTSRTNSVASTAGVWQEFQLPITNFGGVNLSQVYGLFSISSTTGATYLVDDVSWTRSTNVTPGIESKMFYSDEGIPQGSDIYVWKDVAYFSHVSPATNDGGFEQSTANGTFPNAGFWKPATAGGSATAQCTTAALYTGAAGLRNKTGTETGSVWCAPYQEHPAVGEDVFQAEAWVRQPSGQGWVSGSEAFVRMSFYDGWDTLLSSVTSAVRVTTAAQGWTQCSIPDTTATVNSAYVRLELVVQKPGSAGVSVADFDDVVLKQGNSFNGQYPGDPSPPEGARCFRSYCVNWSGWGVFYTNNTTVDLSDYGNGYLKFFLKSSGYTKVEIQSVAGGVTNTAIGAWYNPTTNSLGAAEWQHKVIPITNFAGVALSNIRSPFMGTDPTIDHAFYIDYVRWEKGP